MLSLASANIVTGDAMNRDEFDYWRRRLRNRVRFVARHVLSKHGFDGYDARDDVPQFDPSSSLDFLKEQYKLTRKMPIGYRLFPVWHGGCLGTIYGDSDEGIAANRLFRAWHDIVHVTHDLNFTPLHEQAVATIQARDIPRGALRNIFLADTLGQTEFAAATGGCFVANQREYVYDYLTIGRDAAIDKHRSSTSC